MPSLDLILELLQNLVNSYDKSVAGRISDLNRMSSGGIASLGPNFRDVKCVACRTVAIGF